MNHLTIPIQTPTVSLRSSQRIQVHADLFIWLDMLKYPVQIEAVLYYFFLGGERPS